MSKSYPGLQIGPLHFPSMVQDIHPYSHSITQLLFYSLQVPQIKSLHSKIN